MYRYEIAWIGIKDVPSSMPILFVDFSTGCGFFLSWPCVSTLNVLSDIWDRVESYAIDMILARRMRITFKPKTKLKIFKQRVFLSVLPPLMQKAPLFAFCLPTYFAGKVGCWRVETRVKTTDMCLSGRRDADMLADMLATRDKKLSAGVPGQHVTACHLLTCRQYVGNMTNI